MISGLVRKIVRETAGFTVVFGVCLLGFHLLLAYIAPIILSELSQSILKTVFVQTLIKGLFGNDAAQSLGTAAVVSFAWIHPIPLALLWGHSLVYWSRMPAGEIENGTLDILLSQPVSRCRVWMSETLVWLGCGLGLILAAVCGNGIGRLFVTPENCLASDALLKLAFNLYGLYIVVGGFAAFNSSFCSHRTTAVGYAFTYVVVSYLIHTLVPFWAAMKHVAFLSFMDYYNPLAIVRNPNWPIFNFGILAGIGVFFWGLGLGIFSRRNLVT